MRWRPKRGGMSSQRTVGALPWANTTTTMTANTGPNESAWPTALEIGRVALGKRSVRMRPRLFTTDRAPSLMTRWL